MSRSGVCARHAMMRLLFAMLFLTRGPLISAATASTPPLRTSEEAFVQREGSRLSLNGERYFFHGANQYYIFYKSHRMIDDVLDDAAAMGLKVMRTWAFCDGEWHDGHSLQPYPRRYNEETFRNLDYAIHRARQLGIRLVFTLINNWDDFGGMNAYIKWSSTARTHDDFYSDPETRALFRDYISYVLHRINTYTGIRYKDDPTILMWELANEPRISKDRIFELYAWINEMAAHIKSIDPNHLVSTGSEGDHASDFELTHQSPHIDVASFHLYPESWGMNADETVQYARNQIQNAHDVLSKPVFCGEYGIRNKGERERVYQTWHRLFEKENVDGSMFWLLSGQQDDGTLYPDYDGFSVYYPESSSTVSIMQNHSNNMNSKSGGRLDRTEPTVNLAPLPSQVSGLVRLAGTASDDRALDRVEVNFGGGFRPAAGKEEWTYIWDTNQVVDGLYPIQVRAVDKEGNKGIRDLTLSVENGSYGRVDWQLRGRKEQDDGYNFIYYLSAQNMTGRVEAGHFVFRYFLNPEDLTVVGPHYENSQFYQGNPKIYELSQLFGNTWYIDIDMGQRTVAPHESIGFKGQIQQAKGGLKSHNDWSSGDFQPQEEMIHRVLLVKDGQAIGGFSP